jgi:hypothetical protein
VDCRAETLAKVDLFTLADANSASYDSASQFIFDLRFAIGDLSNCVPSAPRKFRGAAAIPGL